MLALNPLLQSLVERSSHAFALRQEVERLEADLRLAKAEVKAARLEVRLLTARRAQAEATTISERQDERSDRQLTSETRRSSAPEFDPDQLLAELEAIAIG